MAFRLTLGSLQTRETFVNGHTFSENSWFFAEAERALPSLTANIAPQGAEVVGEAALCLAGALALALAANIWLAVSAGG